jgi:DNA-directed RNA polymerase specialized sigma subunit
VDAKEYLSQAFQLDQRINSKLEQVSMLRDLALKTTSVLQDDKVQSTKQQSPMENALVKLISLEEEINDDIDQLIDLKRELATFVDEIENPSHRLLLELRYLSGNTWEEVAVLMGYDVRWVYRLHRKALKEATERIENNTVECI